MFVVKISARLLTICACTFALLGATSQANSEEAIEEVVVTAKSIKASQMAAIEAKRFADNVADVISADAIGRFPDQNLADALGRIPGMSIERDQGQARYINFRGSPKRYTTVAFDGIDVPGVENGRIPRFDAYPAVITSQVMANKAITADMPGESVSGYINVKTFTPSDIEGWSVSLEIGTGEQDLGEGDISRKNARVSYSNDRFGVMFYGSRNLREQVTDNREPEYGGGTKGALLPGTVEFRNYFVNREDEAYGGRLEYYLDNGGKIYFSSLNTEFKDYEERNQWNFIFPDDAPAGTGTVPNANVRRLLEDGEYLNQTDVNTLGADLIIGEWDVQVSYSDIETVFDTYLPVPYLIGFNNISNVFYDVRNPEKPIVTFDENLADLEYAVPYMADAIGNMETETDQFKIDLSRSNKWGVMKFGAKYDTRDAEGGGAPLSIFITGMFTIDFQPETIKPWHTDMNNTVGGYYADNSAIWEALQESGYSRNPFPDEDLVSIEETIVSGYIMQTIDRDWGNIVVGIRVEDTEYETTGSKLVGTALQPLTVSNDYTNVLPNAHVNWDFAEDKKLRFSVSSGISRPTYIEARAAATVDVLSLSIAGGNPELEEEKSWGIDAAYEWYFNDASLFSATIFHRSIDNVIAESNERVLGSIYSDVALPGELWDLSGFGNGKDGKLQGLELAFTGRLDNYIEGFWSGFGLEANATFLDSEFTTPTGDKFDMPGQSETTYNISLFYEDHGLSARLSYRYRDEWLDETETSLYDTVEPIYWAEQERLDLSIRYDLEGLTGYKASIFLDVNNITDETDIRFTGHDWNPNQIESYGRRYLVGVRFNL